MSQHQLQKIGALVASPEKLLSAPTNAPEEIAFATKAAAVLFGSYPAAKAHDPEIFTAQVTRLFLRYSRAVVSEVVQELPTRRDKGWDGLPSMARLTEALDELEGRYARRREREENVDRMFKERDEFDRARNDAPSREEFVAKHPDVAKRLGWVDMEPAKETPDEIMGRLGISKEQWDAIPDSSPPKGQAA